MIQKLRQWNNGNRSLIVTKLLRAKGLSVDRNLSVLDIPRVSAWGGGHITIGANVTLGVGVRIIVANGGELTIEDGVIIRDYCNIECSGRMVIGRNTLLANGVIIYCEGEVIIEPDVLIAAYCLIADVDHKYMDEIRFTLPRGQEPAFLEEICSTGGAF